MNGGMEFGVAALLTLSGGFFAIVMFAFCILLLFRRAPSSPGSEAGLAGLTLISAGICVAAMPYAVIAFSAYSEFERSLISSIGIVLLAIGLYLLIVLANQKSAESS